MCRNGIKLIKRYIYIYTCILSIQSSLSIICIFLKLICSNVFTAESNFCQIFVHLKAGLSPSEVVWGIKFSRGNDFLSKFSTFSFEKMPQRVAEVVSMGSLSIEIIFMTRVLGAINFHRFHQHLHQLLPNQGHCYIFRSCDQLLSKCKQKNKSQTKIQHPKGLT